MLRYRCRLLIRSMLSQTKSVTNKISNKNRFEQAIFVMRIRNGLSDVAVQHRSFIQQNLL